MTRTRLAVLAAHATVDALAAAVRARSQQISTQATYDVLHALTVAGLARRIQPAGSPPCAVGGAGAGFVVDEVEITYWGLCPGCRTRRAGGSRRQLAAP